MFLSFSKEKPMGWFDSIKDQVSGVLSGSDETSQAGLLEALGGLLNHPELGGLQGLIHRFEEKGLGAVASSWVGTGENMPISGEMLQQVLGSDKIQAYADKLGMSTQDASDHLAEVLPQVVDTLTPNGSVEEGGVGQALGGILNGLL
jgi:uncharacterized protein YidB (DUF937 family)